jgi:hypothetical protein
MASATTYTCDRCGQPMAPPSEQITSTVQINFRGGEMQQWGFTLCSIQRLDENEGAWFKSDACLHCLKAIVLQGLGQMIQERGGR